MEETPPTLSFPEILRNPGLSSRYAHLHSERHSTQIRTGVHKLTREQNEGKRWIRRKDNARFTGNPHIVLATKRDYALQPPLARSTFPEPLPPYLPRNVKLPTTTLPIRDPSSANAGRFSLSLKGMRRDLRRSGFRAEALVRNVEHEMVEWLQTGGTVLAPDADDRDSDITSSPGILVGDTGTISEVSRTPLRLIWSITDDPFARYVVHCCARYHEVVSFSKEVSGRRLTYLLRPNVTRPDHHAPGNLDTPPITDIDHSSQLDTESDRGGLEIDSDAEQQPPPLAGYSLSAISEDLPSPVTHFPSPPLSNDEAWSMIGDTDGEGDESGSEAGLAASLDSLSLLPELVPELESDGHRLGSNDTTPRASLHLHQQSLVRRRGWDYQHRRERSASSPSRSPARGSYRRGGRLRFDPPRSNVSALPKRHDQSFYDYLYS